MDLHSIPEEFYRFVSDHLDEDTASLALKYGVKDFEFSLSDALIQIECRKRTSYKLKPFLNIREFIFPDRLVSEQSTDWRVARCHATLVGKGKRVLDMTAGLGIDAFTLSRAGNEVTAIELDSARAKALMHNFRKLEIIDFEAIEGDSVRFLKDTDRRFDVIFIDPARRGAGNRRTYGFADCTPDVPSILDSMLEHSDRIFIKSSPVLDLTQTIRELKFLKKIHIICVKGECKEVLAEISKGCSFEAVEVLDLDDDGVLSQFTIDAEKLGKPTDNIASEENLTIESYIYVPNAGMMKTNSSHAIVEVFPSLKKISKNTNIYVSDNLIKDFPGDVIKVTAIPDKKALKTLKGSRLNVAVRNYPVDAAALKKKLGVKDSIDDFLYAFRAFSKETPVIIIGKRL